MVEFVAAVVAVVAVVAVEQYPELSSGDAPTLCNRQNSGFDYDDFASADVSLYAAAVAAPLELAVAVELFASCSFFWSKCHTDFPLLARNVELAPLNLLHYLLHPKLQSPPAKILNVSAVEEPCGACQQIRVEATGDVAMHGGEIIW